MPQPRVQSLDRALDLLEALASAGELGVSDLAARTGLVPSTAHRLLATLVERGYAAQSASGGRYLIGYKLLELASGLAEHDDADRARLAEITARRPRVRAHLIAGAGHWVHVDAPDALFAVVQAGLSA